MLTGGRPCFSPRSNASEILDSHSDLTLPTVAPGQTRGRSVSSALPCISFHNRAEGTAGTLQRGKFPATYFHPETYFSISSAAISLRTQPHRKITAHSKLG